MIRRGVVSALTAALLLTGAPASADNVIADGDLPTPILGSAPLAFGNVPVCGGPVGKPVILVLQRSGDRSSRQVFADGSVVSLHLTGRTASGQATFIAPPAPPPGGVSLGAMTLPAGWTTQLVGTTSGDLGLVVRVIVVLAPAAPGAFSGSLTFEARGTSTTGEPLTRSATMPVTADVLPCGDSTPPTLSLPGPITVEASGPDGTSVTFPASASDQSPANPPVSCTPLSGSLFPIGTTTVTCSATDAAGNTATGTFPVTVVDTTGPVIGAVSDVTAEATAAAGATVTYATPSADDAVDGTRPVSCTPASGSSFPLGSTIVTCSSTDTRGNIASRDFTVLVRDTTAPVLLLPADVTAEATAAAGAAVSYPASAADTVDGPLDPICAPPSGAVFELGQTTVTCTATDAAGNAATGSFLVTVRDTTPPALTGVPAAITVEATGPAGAAVSYPSPTADDLVDGPVPVTCSPATGETFPLGTTTVGCSASDAAGNTARGTFTVTVADTTPPALTLPADQVLLATSLAGSDAVYSASATDLVDGALEVGCVPASGTTFPIGSTTVACQVTDAAGNTATGSFVVIVRRSVLGFYAPVDGNRVVNTVKAGRTVPLKFEVFAGPTEITTTDVVAPLSVKRFNCDPNAQLDAIEVTASGDTVLRYDLTAGQYVFNWKTPTTKACYQVAVSTTDGATIVATFRTT